MIEIIDMVENTQHFKYHRLWYLFLYFGIFHSKSVIMLVLCLFLAKKYFNQFSLSVLKMNDTVNFKDNVFVHFQWLSNQNFHSESVILIVLCLVLTDSLFSTNFTRWFKGKLFR